jgi:hypothetical protein
MAKIAQHRKGVRETRINGRKLRIDRDGLPSSKRVPIVVLSVAASQIGPIRPRILRRMRGNWRIRAGN